MYLLLIIIFYFYIFYITQHANYKETTTGKISASVVIAKFSTLLTC